MIGALQRILARHRRWLLICLLVIVVVPFVFTIGASPGIGRGKRHRARPFFDVNLSSPKEVEELQRATAFSLHFSGAPEGISLDAAMMARAAWLWLARRLQVPGPDQWELDEFLRSRPAFCDSHGQFSEKRAQDFFGALREQAPELEPFIARTLADDWRVGRVAAILSSADFSLPLETSLLMKQLHTRWTLAGAQLHFANFNPAIAVADGELEDFFASNREVFRLPARVQVDYVCLSVLPDEVSDPTEEQLLEYIQRRGGRESDGEMRDVLRENESEIRSAYIADAVEQIVRARAGEFVYRLYAGDGLPGREEVAAIAREFGLSIRSLEPMYEDVLEDGGPLPREVLAVAFELDEEHPFSHPIPVENDAYVLFLRKKDRARDRAFWEVRTEVEEYFRARKRIELFANYAKGLRKQLQGRLAGGEDFAEAAGQLGMAVREPISFTLKDLPEEIPPDQVGSFLPLKKGDLSEFLVQRMDLLLWFVEERREPELAPDGEEIAVAESARRAAAGPAFLRRLIEELIRNEMEK